MGRTHAALIRGINVGTAKRVAMADLRRLVEGLGYREVATLLNSGNVVFAIPGEAGGDAGGDAAARIGAAMAADLGVAAPVQVVPRSTIERAVGDNPLVARIADPSRAFVAFLADPADRRLEPLLAQAWEPEALALGPGVAWLWCPDGLLKSRLPAAVERVLKDRVTMRNWATTTRLLGLFQGH